MSPGGRLIRAAAHHRNRRRVIGAVLRTVAPVLPRRAPPHDPIFIVGSPRSGTTALFELLKRSSCVAALERESHVLWEIFHPRGRADWRSDEIQPEEIAKRERQVLYWALDRLSGGKRYLDKAPANSLRVLYLDELFPSASFVFMKRDGRAVVSSLLTAWNDPGDLFPGRPTRVRLSIDGYSGVGWKFLAPPGWEQYAAGRSLAEVCVYQWKASIEAILAARERIPAERWVEVRYEDLVRNPSAEAGRLLKRLGLPEEREVLDFALSLDRHMTKAVAPPQSDRERRDHAASLSTVLPVIEPTMRRLGYQIDDGPGRHAIAGGQAYSSTAAEGSWDGLTGSGTGRPDSKSPCFPSL